MSFNLTASFTPKFITSKIVSETITKDWFQFQDRVFDLGQTILQYLQTYITSHSHRDGKTGTLANAMRLYSKAVPGEATVGWGIGKISELDQLAPYWHLVNFGGKTFVAQFGMGVGGSFNGDAPISSKAGTNIGTQRFDWAPYTEGSFVMFPKNPIRPMNYIEATKMQIDREIRTLLIQVKNSTASITDLGTGMDVT